MFPFRSGKKGDYHDSMNYDCFTSWFVEQRLPNILQNSSIIMDNASYHTKVINRALDRSTKKCDIIKWLATRGIPHDAWHTKAELLYLPQENKAGEINEVVQIASAHGHKILKLPPHHC